jgi:hypothetical protein
MQRRTFSLYLGQRKENRFAAVKRPIPWSMGTAKAAVFPVPVCAWPSTSRPASRRGIARAWIGVAVA